MSRNEKISKMAFYLVPFGIAVNFIGGQVVNLLKLPIYLDAVGTMIVGALCGPFYSIVTALVTGGLMGITNPTSLFYLGNYLAVGLAAGLFAYGGYFKSVWKCVVIGLVIGMICGVAGSLVTIGVFGGYSASPRGVITGFIVKTFNLGIYPANTISECLTDISDKIPSAIITYIIIKSVPNRFLLKLPLGQRYIASKTQKS